MLSRNNNSPGVVTVVTSCVVGTDGTGVVGTVGTVFIVVTKGMVVVVGGCIVAAAQ